MACDYIDHNVTQIDLGADFSTRSIRSLTLSVLHECRDLQARTRTLPRVGNNSSKELCLAKQHAIQVREP